MANSKKKSTTKKKKASADSKKKKAVTIQKTTLSFTQYIDSSHFFPSDSADGYAEDFQGGRYTKINNKLLQAPVLLPVGATIQSMSIYYKNTSNEPMPVAVLKKHISHYCFSGEVEVSLDNCLPGFSAPDDYLIKIIDHFDAGGEILNNYLYFIQVFNTTKIDDTQCRALRGISISYMLGG